MTLNWVAMAIFGGGGIIICLLAAILIMGVIHLSRRGELRQQEELLTSEIWFKLDGLDKKIIQLEELAGRVDAPPANEPQQRPMDPEQPTANQYEQRRKE